MQTVRLYTVDLTKVRGKGQFKCPKCGTKISPDDTSERMYTICETVMKGESLDKLVLQCNTCRSQIHLTGFRVLDKIRC